MNRSKRNTEVSAVKAKDSSSISLMMERMTAYDPMSRPTLKEIENVLGSNACRFGILLENTLTGEHHAEITRSFTGSPSYTFTPEKEYLVNLATIAPISTEPMLIPFRLVKKQYVLPVAYAAEGRWNNVVEKEGVDSLEMIESGGEYSSEVGKASAALYFCDAVYGIEGDALFCESDGYTYEMGFYEYSRGDESKRISIVRDGEVAVPERLEARILSILREADKTICDLYCVGVYGKDCTGGKLDSAVITALNNIFPEAVRIYKLDNGDLLKGAALFNKNTYPKEAALPNEL
jgi:hypothetical protein